MSLSWFIFQRFGSPYGSSLTAPIYPHLPLTNLVIGQTNKYVERAQIGWRPLQKGAAHAILVSIHWLASKAMTNQYGQWVTVQAVPHLGGRMHRVMWPCWTSDGEKQRPHLPHLPWVS